VYEDEISEDDVILDDDDDDDKEDDKKMTLRQKLQAVQDATQTVQNALGDIASIVESTRKYVLTRDFHFFLEIDANKCDRRSFSMHG